MRALKVFCCAIALAACVAPGARADEWNKLTYLTFSAPVQLPGVTLPAGTYAFKLADSWSNRHIVQVFDRNQSKIYGTFLTVSDQKLDPSGKPLVMFRESKAGTPTAVRAWFYPGDTIGDEFVYPKHQAVEIAKNAHQSVMAMEEEGGNDVSQMKGAKVGHVDESGQMTADNEDNRANAENSAQAGATSGTTGAYTAAPREADHRTGVSENGDVMNRYNDKNASASNRTTNQSMATGGETVTSGQPGQATGTTAPRGASNNATVGTSGQASANQANANPNADNNHPARSRRHLPQTASPLGLFALLSGLSIAGAAGLRQVRRRYASMR